MSRKRKRRPPAASGDMTGQGGGGIAEAGPQAQGGMQGADSTGEGSQPTQYIFTFELIRHYPTVRSFLVKQRLKRSFGDTVSEFFGGNKKGSYRI
jgi:hypothetical protein